MADMTETTGEATTAKDAAKSDGMLKTGIIGTAITAICCFTPALVIRLGAVGFSAWLGWLDYVLLPTLAVFLAITGYAMVCRSRRGA
ncbi:MAG: mercury resistance system transport protein MerF [Rhodospirillales bacterium]|jgi:mercuric ion transport protein|nr:mercury resistance system transport protein MerF [Rhodospirillales bacterium]